MNPIFTLQYGEFKVADTLMSHFKGKASVFIPASSQEKGIDLLLYKYEDGKNLTTTIQVKMSRSYNTNKRYTNTLWFERFEPQKNSNWFILTGVYAGFPKVTDNRAGDAQWDYIMLAFTYNEMVQFMDELCLKKDSNKADTKFYFGFNNKTQIRQTRGFSTERDMSKYLIENRYKDIENSFC